LDNDEYVDLALTESGMKASLTAKGRLALGLYRPFPAQPAPEPARSRSKTGRERALVIGISDYPSPIRRLPAVANDVREMANLLGSDRGQFPAQNVLRLTDAEATSQKVIEGDFSITTGSFLPRNCGGFSSPASRRHLGRPQTCPGETLRQSMACNSPTSNVPPCF
jgi:hypothetical protein